MAGNPMMKWSKQNQRSALTAAMAGASVCAILTLVAPAGSQTQPLPPMDPVAGLGEAKSPLSSAFGGGAETPSAASVPASVPNDAKVVAPLAAKAGPAAIVQENRVGDQTSDEDAGPGGSGGSDKDADDLEAAPKPAALDKKPAPAPEAKPTAATVKPVSVTVPQSPPKPRVVLDHPSKESIQKFVDDAEALKASITKQPAAPAPKPAKAVAAPKPATLPGVLKVHVDRAAVVQVPDAVSSLLIGNPMIVDLTIQRTGLGVITGKAPGSTNLIALNERGDVISESEIVVAGYGARNHVTIIQAGKQGTRQSFVCAGQRCDEAISPSDSNAIYTETAGRYRQYLNDQKAAAQGGTSSASIGEQSPMPMPSGAPPALAAVQSGSSEQPLAGAPPMAFPNTRPEPVQASPLPNGLPWGILPLNVRPGR